MSCQSHTTGFLQGLTDCLASLAWITSASASISASAWKWSAHLTQLEVIGIRPACTMISQAERMQECTKGTNRSLRLAEQCLQSLTLRPIQSPIKPNHNCPIRIPTNCRYVVASSQVCKTKMQEYQHRHRMPEINENIAACSLVYVDSKRGSQILKRLYPLWLQGNSLMDKFVQWNCSIHIVGYK